MAIRAIQPPCRNCFKPRLQFMCTVWQTFCSHLNISVTTHNPVARWSVWMRRSIGFWDPIYTTIMDPLPTIGRIFLELLNTLLWKSYNTMLNLVNWEGFVPEKKDLGSQQTAFMISITDFHQELGGTHLNGGSFFGCVCVSVMSLWVISPPCHQRASFLSFKNSSSVVTFTSCHESI